jgi:deferrochelatase/peroxidase EfeB
MQDFVTIAIPFAEKAQWNPLLEADVTQMIEVLGNPASDGLRAKLDKNHDGSDGHIHFMSINVIGATPEDPSSFVLIEATVDGDPNAAIGKIAGAMGDELFPILALACGLKHRDDLPFLLMKHSQKMSHMPFRRLGNIIGFPFVGTPGFSVAEIRRNHTMFLAARGRIFNLRASNSDYGAQSIFAEVHNAFKQDAELAQALAMPQQPLPFVETRGATWLQKLKDPRSGIPVFLTAAIRWLILLLAFPAFLLFITEGKSQHIFSKERFINSFNMAEKATWDYAYWPDVIYTLLLTIILALLFVAIEIGVVVWLLRSSEAANQPQDLNPDPATMAKMMSRENNPNSEQNHMISTTIRLPGLLRRLTLFAGFFAVATAARLGLMRAGFLANLGTIHSARWVVMPGTRKLVFLSNYDGSWESYLEDFITKASMGATGIWSNTIGFPRTNMLFMEGAEDGDSFKRFARHSMQPTAFWYSAYPELTCQQIRKHAVVVSGLRNADVLCDSPLDAEAWLDQFSTIPRPEYALEYDEIQTLMFSGLKDFKQGCLLGVKFGAPSAKRLPGDHPYIHVQRWLAKLYEGYLIDADVTGASEATKTAVYQINFGNQRPKYTVVNIAFSASGLRKLGLERELDFSTERSANGNCEPTGFPFAFAGGMTHPSRKRILSDPNDLAWSDADTDAVLLVYARQDDWRQQDWLEKALQHMHTLATVHGIEIAETIKTKLIPFNNSAYYADWHAQNPQTEDPPEKFSNERELSIEPFGFVDGVSQPKVRGFPGRQGQSDAIHDVEPGEFVLGYQDNRGYFPPSPHIVPGPCQIGMRADRVLPGSADNQPQKFPDFSNSRTTFGDPRDFGRNGSYLVVRQLAQDVDGFDKQLNALNTEVVNKFRSRQRTGTDAIEPLNPYGSNWHRSREWVAAKMVGRWRNGTSLVSHPLGPNLQATVAEQADNDFLFKDVDPQGLRCPLGSHIRRTFPRDSLSPEEAVEISVTNRHRLLRRGRPFLNDKGEAAGTLFMCFNADIERQFEFVQQSWMGSSSFQGLDSEVDPFAMHKTAQPTPTSNDYGRPDSSGGSQSQLRFTIQGPAAPLCLHGLESFVTLLGGGYFFMPGKHALWFLAGAAWKDDESIKLVP